MAETREVTLIQPFPATEEERSRSQRWAAQTSQPTGRNALAAIPSPPPPPPPPLIPAYAFEARDALPGLVAASIPGATAANARVLDATPDGRVHLTAMLVRKTHPLAQNPYTAEPYRFVVRAGQIVSMEPAVPQPMPRL